MNSKRFMWPPSFAAHFYVKQEMWYLLLPFLFKQWYEAYIWCGIPQATCFMFFGCWMMLRVVRYILTQKSYLMFLEFLHKVRERIFHFRRKCLNWNAPIYLYILSKMYCGVKVMVSAGNATFTIMANDYHVQKPWYLHNIKCQRKLY